MKYTTNHPTAQDLAAFAKGNAPPGQVLAIEEHLDVCDSCSKALEQQTAPTEGLLGASPSDDAPTTNLGDTEAYEDAHSPRVKNNVFVSLQNHPRYRVLKLLGAGGMGEVYLAEHVLMKRKVALKVIGENLLEHRDSAERFVREVEAAARLDHHNIVRAHDAEQAGGMHFLVMEFVEGQTLAEVIRTRGPLPVVSACNYIFQAALGLQHAHERGMVHRDIKPQNLMLTTEGRVKILDFGLARFASENALKASLTQTGVAMGTPDFMAPEQAQDARSADIRADIYSLGCTLYYLLTASLPFPDKSMMLKLMAHANQEPTKLSVHRPGIPPEVASIVTRMMAKKPADRFQTPQEVVHALKPVVQGVGTATPAKGVPTQPQVEAIRARDAAPPPVEKATPRAIIAARRIPGQARVPDGKKQNQTAKLRIAAFAVLGLGIIATCVFLISNSAKSKKTQDKVVVAASTSNEKAKAPKSTKPDPDKEIAKLQGTWRAVAAESFGKEIPDAKVKWLDCQLIIEGNQYTWKMGPPLHDGTFKVDVATTPHHLDLSSKSGVTKCIYKFEGDRLIIFPAEERPTEFRTDSDDGRVIYTMTRETAVPAS